MDWLRNAVNVQQLARQRASPRSEDQPVDGAESQKNPTRWPAQEPSHSRLSPVSTNEPPKIRPRSYSLQSDHSHAREIKCELCFDQSIRFEDHDLGNLFRKWYQRWMVKMQGVPPNNKPQSDNILVVLLKAYMLVRIYITPELHIQL